MGWRLNAKPFFLNSDQYFQSKFLLFLRKKKFGEIIFFVSCKIFSFSFAASFLFYFLSDLIWRRKSFRPTFLKWGSRWPEAKSMSAFDAGSAPSPPPPPPTSCKTFSSSLLGICRSANSPNENQWPTACQHGGLRCNGVRHREHRSVLRG